MIIPHYSYHVFRLFFFLIRPFSSMARTVVIRSQRSLNARMSNLAEDDRQPAAEEVTGNPNINNVSELSTTHH